MVEYLSNERLETLYRELQAIKGDCLPFLGFITPQELRALVEEVKATRAGKRYTLWVEREAKGWIDLISEHGTLEEAKAAAEGYAVAIIRDFCWRQVWASYPAEGD